MKYTIQTIECGAYLENAYLVCPEGRADAFIIDPGDDLSALEAALAASGRTLGGMLLTHGHFDHMLCAQPLQAKTGAPVYVHGEDAILLEDTAINAFDPAAASMPFPEGLQAEMLGDAIEICGVRFLVLHTPGHTRGCVCYYDAENGVLFSGDTLFRAGFGRMDLYGGSPQSMRASLRRLFDLPGETRVLCGHGPETTISDERARYRL